MKDFIERVKADVILSALLCVALGVVVMVWPDKTLKILCYILAAILIVMGAGKILAYMTERELSRFGLAAGIILCLLGGWILISPLRFVALFPFIVGIILLMHGMEDVKLALDARANGDEIWWSLLVIALLNFLFGALLLWKAFEAVTIAMIFLGCALIYDGVSDLFVVYRAVRSEKMAKKMLLEYASRAAAEREAADKAEREAADKTERVGK